MELLAGPRGRRLCFEVAVEMAGENSDLWRAMVEVSIKFETAGRLFFDERPPSDMRTVAHVVAGLDAVELRSIGRQHLYAAFQRSVDAARPYQEPDGFDRVLGLEALREPLLRFADYIRAHEETAWWDDPMTGEQWEAFYLPEELEGEMSLPSAAGLDHESAMDEWWTMPFMVQTTSRIIELGAPAHAYLHEDSFGEDLQGYRLTPEQPVLELTIGSWVDLCKRFPYDRGRGVWDEATGTKGTWVMPDWRQVAKHYAGVHLSPAAYLECAEMPIAVGNKLSVMAGFAADATYWLVDLERGSRRIWRHLDLC